MSFRRVTRCYILCRVSPDTVSLLRVTRGPWNRNRDVCLMQAMPELRCAVHIAFNSVTHWARTVAENMCSGSFVLRSVSRRTCVSLHNSGHCQLAFFNFLQLVITKCRKRKQVKYDQQ
jgi:hypothetical protein